MKKYESLIFYVLLGIVVIALVFSIYSFYNSRYGTNYQKAISSENTSDICATPAGYTDEAWREHMGHHPDRYKDCFK